MLKDLSFLLVLRCLNGLYTYCTICTQIVGGHGCLFRHITDKHASTGEKKSVPELLKTRPDLDAIVKARRFVLPDAWPDDVPPIAGIQTTTAYECLLCLPGAVVRRSNERTMKKHLREDHSPKEKVFGLHYQLCPIQSWYPHNPGGMGRN
jgi:hypothetical protein